MKRVPFSSNLLAATISSLCALSLPLLSSVVLAQQGSASQEGLIQEIVVQGSYSKSLQSALENKRNAVDVVHAIAAEDIGKFPRAKYRRSLAARDRCGGSARLWSRGLCALAWM